MSRILRPVSLATLICLVCFGAAFGFDRAAEHARKVGSFQPEQYREHEQMHQERSGLSAQALTDYMISQPVIPARFMQQDVSLARLKSGQWLAVWSDDRNGANKIFGQKLSATGIPVGVNQQLAGSTDGANYLDPQVSVDTAGHIFLFYRDNTNGRIFGERLDSNLNVTVAKFAVNDTTAVAYAGLFDVAVYPDGHFVAVWEHTSIDSSVIKMRIFSETAVSVVGPTTITTDDGTTNKWEPHVDVEPNSGFLVAWEDYRTGNGDIYARLFDGAGTGLGAEFNLIPPGAQSAVQSAPRVIYSTRDKYLIGWIDFRSGQGVYIQRYDATSGIVGANELVSDSNISVLCWNLDLSVNPTGDLRAVWETTPQANILLRAFTTGFVQSGGVVTVNLSSVGGRSDAAIAHAANGNFSVAWEEIGTDEPDIAFMLFTPPSTRQLGDELMLNDDQRGSPASDPAIKSCVPGTNLVAFASVRRDAGDIILGNINNGGILQRSNVQVNQDSAGFLQYQPGLAVSPTKVLTVWGDGRDVLAVPGQRIYGRFSDAQGTFLANEFMISDSAQLMAKTEPKAAMNSASKALVAWLDSRSGVPQVIGRWLTTAGALDGAEISISSTVTDSNCVNLTVACDSSGNFYAIWLDNGLDTAKVKGHWYNADSTNGGSFTWKPAATGTTILQLAADVTPAGTIALLWSAITPSGTSLFLSIINKSGGLLSGPVEVIDASNVLPHDPSIAVSSVANYVSCVWADYRDGKEQVYYQMLDNTYSLLNTNQLVSSTTPDYMRTPATNNIGGRAWFVWVDPRQYGDNVWGSFDIYLPTDADDHNKPSLPASFVLGQNYPNPFNPSTEIPFSLPEKSDVSLVLYNILGEQVRTLIRETRPAGSYKVVWDGRDDSSSPVASGVYFYRLQVGDVRTVKKMLLVK